MRGLFCIDRCCGGRVLLFDRHWQCVRRRSAALTPWVPPPQINLLNILNLLTHLFDQYLQFNRSASSINIGTFCR